MCKEFITLIEQSSWHYTAQCEHGTIHLRWGDITLSLQPADFALLTNRVCAEYHLLQPQSGRMRLNIGQTALEFAYDDFQPLVELMQQTVAKLDFVQQKQVATQTTDKLTQGSSLRFPIASKNIHLN